jgi:hypothetical protein
MSVLLLVKISLGIYLFGIISALSYNFWIKREGAKGIAWSQCMNPIKHLSVVVGFIFSLIPQHIFEQYVLRVYDDYCRPNCLLGNGGRCDSCGCNTYAKMMSPLEEDSRGNWSKRKYKEHREKYPVKIEPKYG